MSQDREDGRKRVIEYVEISCGSSFGVECHGQKGRDGRRVDHIVCSEPKFSWHTKGNEERLDE